MRAVAVITVALCLASTAGAQLPKKPKPDSCSIIKPFTALTGEVISPKAASATYERLANRWSIDTASAAREIQTFLVRNPRLAGEILGASESCPKGGCVCPRLPKVAQTYGQSASLDAFYRSEPQGTASATASFLADHPWVLSKARDSIFRSNPRASSALREGILTGQKATRITIPPTAVITRPPGGTP